MEETFDKYEFDTCFFDWIILGTDLSESIISASLASRGQKVLNIESSFHYSGIHSSFNFRDLKKALNVRLSSPHSLLKNIHISFPDLSDKNLEEFTKRVGFRAATIDMLPQFLFAEAYSTQELTHIKIDNYVTFSTVKSVLYYNDEEPKELPLTKSDILKSSLLNINEKKQLISFLSNISSIFSEIDDSKEINNSTNEFEKNIYSEQKIKNFDCQLKSNLKENGEVFFKKFFGKPSDVKLEQIIKLCLLGELDFSFSAEFTVEKIFKQLKNAYKSISVTGKTPFLYVNYGTGDLSQVYSRISAVHGGIFLISEALILKSIKLSEEGVYLLTYQHGPYEYEFSSKNILVGPEYISYINSFLHKPISVKETFIFSLYLLAKVESRTDKEFDPNQLPCIMWVPCGDSVLKNLNPLKIFVSGSSSKSNEKGFISIKAQTTQKEILNDPKLETFIIDLIGKKFEVSLKSDILIKFDIISCESEEQNFETFDNVHFIYSLNKSLTVDDYFSQCNQFLIQKHVKSSEENIILKKDSEYEVIEEKDHLKILEDFNFNEKNKNSNPEN